MNRRDYAPGQVYRLDAFARRAPKREDPPPEDPPADEMPPEDAPAPADAPAEPPPEDDRAEGDPVPEDAPAEPAPEDAPAEEPPPEAPEGDPAMSDEEAAKTPSRFVASTAAPDRYGSIIRQDWRLDAYRANPVVLLQHDGYSRLPIGRGTVEVVNGQLEVVVEWDAADPLARSVAGKVKRGFLNAVSVGFSPGSVGFRDELPEDDPDYGEGPILSSCELLEISVVTVPGNSAAVVSERNAPRDLDALAAALVPKIVAGLRAAAKPPPAPAKPAAPAPKPTPATAPKRAAVDPTLDAWRKAGWTTPEPK